MKLGQKKGVFWKDEKSFKSGGVSILVQVLRCFGAFFEWVD